VTDSQHGPLTIGRVIAGRYEVARLLEDGPLGTVYQARSVDPARSGHKLAVHVLPEALGKGPLPGRLQREARMLASIHEQHLVGVLELLEDDGLGLIVTELVEAPCLAAILAERGALPVERALDVAVQLCRALEAAHEVGVIHRALDARDVLLEGWSLGPGRAETTERTAPLVRVSGFVLRALLRGLGPQAEQRDLAWIDTEAPEQARAEEPDPRSDLYAVGALLCGMLLGTGTPGSDGQTPSGRERLASLRQLGREQGIPDAVVRVVTKAMAPSAEDRYAAASELGGELRGLLEGLHAAAEPFEQPAQPSDDVAGTAVADDPEVAAETLAGGGSGDGQAAIEGAIGTTMKSHRDSALEASVPRGAKVQVLVGEAAPAAPDEWPKSSAPRPSSHTRQPGQDGARERQLWLLMALLAAVAAVAIGVWLGVR
jgi:eukaryotic-like serine/threonine-protein kinase